MKWTTTALGLLPSRRGFRLVRCLGGVFMLSATMIVQGFAQDALAPLKAHVAANPKGRALYSADLAKLGRGHHQDLPNLSDLPIGVFDSGIGGLTVLEALLSLDLVNNRTLKAGSDGVPDFAGERFIYLGDQANMPYGNYPAAGRTDYLRELIMKDAIFLLGRRYHRTAGKPARFDKPPVKAIVIACNTGTAYGLEDIRIALKEWGVDIPVIGVVEAGAEAVAELLPAGGPAPSVGVLATVGTCASGAYPAAIAKAAARSGKAIPVVVQQGSVGLAGAIEGNPAFVTEAGATSRPVPYQGPALNAEVAQVGGLEPGQLLGDTLNTVLGYIRFDVASLMAGFRDQHPQAPPMGFVVLGCTHFPLVERDMAEAFRRTKAYRDGTGAQPFDSRLSKGLILVNPAEYSARALFREMSARGLRRASKSRVKPKVAGFYVTVPNPAAPGVVLGGDGALDNAYRLGRALGNFAQEDTAVVTLTPKNLPVTSRSLVQALPKVWQTMKEQHR
ncbi:MAG: aspartate/glutamate racemase family protein [Holophagaceae bacterium]|nr:aspartate/glutamate racemase family protein [Holophagaceae bacterium]